MVPTQKGHRLLPTTLDYLAEHSPTRIYACIPLTSSLDDGFRDVTVLELSRAVHACAYWLNETIGKSDAFETISYVGVNDLRYAIFWFAAMKCGYKAFFFSPRNTIEQITSLLQQTNCCRLFHSAELKAVIQDIRDCEKKELERLEIWLTQYEKPFPFTKTFEEARDDPVLVLHSSGSTGNPKAVIHSHNFFATQDRPLPVISGREIGSDRMIDFEGGGFVLYPFPAFHITGIQAQCLHPIFSPSATLVLPLPDRPITAEQVLSTMKQKKFRMLVLPPSILEALSQQEDSVKALKEVETIIFGGGPLSQPVGDMLSQHVNLIVGMGSTELGTIPQLKKLNPQDWSWFEWHPAANITMELVKDETYEMVLYEDPVADNYRSGSSILRQNHEFRTKDLFLRHPTNPNLWQFQVRTDDIIVFSNGEKWFPVPSEGLILGHPKVSGVMIVGNGRFEAAALIETKESLTINELWPTIELANSKSPTFGHISKSKIAILPAGSLTRSPKGSVVRKLSTQNNAGVIEDLYSESTLDVECLEQEKIHEAVKEAVHSITVLQNAGENDDLFAFGVNSLQILEIVRKLKQVGVTGATSTLVFTNPTINRLCAALYGRRPTEVLLEDVIQRYSAQITYTSKQRTTAAPRHIVLTGSTGSLGKEILARLCQCTDLHITCVNRSEPQQRLPDVAYLKIDMNQPSLGLSRTDVDQLKSADVIVHNAWKVDFNHGLSSFEPLLQGLVEICNLGPRVVFIGSGSAVWNYTVRRVPEALILDSSNAAHHAGYSQSKYVAERLVGDIPGNTVLRVGQVAASTVSGSEPWNQNEWFPSLLKTSMNLGCLPYDLPARIDWVPRDIAAQAIVDLTLHGHEGVYNIFNPQPRSWSQVFPKIQFLLDVKSTSFAEWVELLESKLYDDVADFPALSLLGYFKEITEGAVFETDRAVAESPAISSLEEIKDEWIEKWICELDMQKVSSEKRAQ